MNPAIRLLSSLYSPSDSCLPPPQFRGPTRARRRRPESKGLGFAGTLTAAWAEQRRQRMQKS